MTNISYLFIILLGRRSQHAKNIAHIIDTLLRSHIYKIVVIHWISYQGPVAQRADSLSSG